MYCMTSFSVCFAISLSALYYYTVPVNVCMSFHSAKVSAVKNPKLSRSFDKRLLIWKILRYAYDSIFKHFSFF